jgi:hypothetical protein
MRRTEFDVHVIYDLYWVQHQSATEIAAGYGVTPHVVLNFMRRNSITIRSMSESGIVRHARRFQRSRDDRLLQLFLARVVIRKTSNPDEHWTWIGGKDRDGYGQLTFEKKTIRAARLSLELFVGKIADAHEPDHLCRIRDCVNFTHLEPVTHLENMRRVPKVMRPLATHCRYGHPYNEENTYTWKDKRQCLMCRRIYWRRYERPEVVLSDGCRTSP